MCHLYPYENVKFPWKFFTLIFAVLLVGTNFYTRPEYLTLVSYHRFKVQLPTSDSIQITAGGPKVLIEGPVPLEAS